MIAFLSKVFVDEAAFVTSVKRTGHYSEEVHKLIIDRLLKARKWAGRYGVGIPSLLPDPSSVKLDDRQDIFLRRLADYLVGGEHSEEEIQGKIYELSKELDLPTRDAFRAVYLTVLGEERGPRASTLIAALERGWVVERFKYNYK
jgi:lysyl-tRNA synthetase class 1